MQIAAKKIIGLAVETKSGRKLGRVRDFDVDVEMLEIKKFYVRPTGLVKRLADGDLIIGKNSVVSLDENRLVVEDLVETELAGNKGYKKELAAAGAPLSASTRE